MSERSAPPPRTPPPRLRPFLPTALLAALGGGLAAAYAHLVGCRTGTCLITSSIWMSAAFFGFTGAVIAHPGGAPRETHPADPGAEPETGRGAR